MKCGITPPGCDCPMNYLAFNAYVYEQEEAATQENEESGLCGDPESKPAATGKISPFDFL